MKSARMVAGVMLALLAGSAAAWASDSTMTVAEVTGLYHEIHARLAEDSTEGVAEAAATMVAKLTPCDCESETKSLYQAVGEAARKMTGKDLAELREQFKEVSRAMAALLEAEGIASTQLYYCPMAEGYWLQQKSVSDTRNPYYGKAMSKCGTKMEKLTS